MKHTFLFLLFTLLTLAACKKDNVGSGCSLDDFVGTYTGTEDCDGSEEAATFTINKAGNSLTLTDNDGNNYELEVDDCSFEIPEVNLIIAEYSGDGFINGDNLTVNLKASALGFTSNCRFEGSK